MGEQSATLELTDAGGVLSGSFTAPQGSTEVSGKLDGDAVEFSGTMQGPMGAVELSFSGTLSGDEMSGEVQFGSFGSGSWSATRS
jgi:L-seryl-tRNA(Ser) seleniumtransferase